MLNEPEDLGWVYIVSGEENGNPLQYSCLEDPRDGGAWQAAVYGVSQSQIPLKRLSSSSIVRMQGIRQDEVKVLFPSLWCPKVDYFA